MTNSGCEVFRLLSCIVFFLALQAIKFVSDFLGVIANQNCNGRFTEVHLSLDFNSEEFMVLFEMTLAVRSYRVSLGFVASIQLGRLQVRVVLNTWE